MNKNMTQDELELMTDEEIHSFLICFLQVFIMYYQRQGNREWFKLFAQIEVMIKNAIKKAQFQKIIRSVPHPVVKLKCGCRVNVPKGCFVHRCDDHEVNKKGNGGD